MTASAAAVPRKGSWRRLALGLVLFLAIPLIPQMRVMFPIEQTFMLLVVLIAACMIVGWRHGGRLPVALMWVVLAVVLVAWPTFPPGSQYLSLSRGWILTSGNGYPSLARGWTLLLAAAFGLVGLFSPASGFFSRALSTLAVAAGLGFVLVLLSPGGPTRIAGTVGLEYTRRNEESIAQLREGANTPPWKDEVDNSPGLQRINQMTEEQLLEIPKWSSMLVPAMLALQSLAAMALAWSLYHRWSPTPIGSPLGRLRDFRFNDQLVWGVAVGASVYLLPAFAEGRNAGLNILVFFGTLYVLRGLGILGWMSNGRKGRIVGALAGAFILAALIADAFGVLVSPVGLIAAFAFAVGLGDTWLDWRTLLQAKPV